MLFSSVYGFSCVGSNGRYNISQELFPALLYDRRIARIARDNARASASARLSACKRERDVPQSGARSIVSMQGRSGG